VIVGGEDGGSFSGGMNRQLRGVALSLFARQRLTTFIAKQRVGDLERLTVLIETGRLTPSLDRTYPLEQVPEAMRHLEDGNARGKVAITI
jgi:NADPH:quinone reductase-like Zn-dependent oxidoreductase